MGMYIGVEPPESVETTMRGVIADALAELTSDELRELVLEPYMPEVVPYSVCEWHHVQWCDKCGW